jgi:hypothetical protein
LETRRAPARRPAAVLALLALLAALPAPAFAAPPELRLGDPAELVLGWLRDLAARLGLAPGGSGGGAGAEPQVGFTAVTRAQMSGSSGETAPGGDPLDPSQQLGSMMDPDG